MKCPFCLHSKTKVIDRNERARGMEVKRRRECPKCLSRWNTMEIIEFDSIIDHYAWRKIGGMLIGSETP